MARKYCGFRAIRLMIGLLNPFCVFVVIVEEVLRKNLQ